MLRFSMTIAAALGVAAVVPAALAQDGYPNRPVRVISPYAPGGAATIVTRILADPLREQLGQNFILDHKPGANGIIANEELGRSRPDGYTLLMGNVTSQALYPLLFPGKYSINYPRDVTIVARVVSIPAFFAVTTKDFPPKTFEEFIDYAKKNRGKVRYSHPGVGSFPHFDGEILAKRVGIEMLAVPNKAGAAGMLKDLATGDAHAAFINVASAAPLIKGGNIRPIAIKNPVRLPDYPDVPTLDELGLKDVGTNHWQGLFAQGATPKPILDTLSRAVATAMETAQVRDAFARQHFNLIPTASSEEARQWLAEEFQHWRGVIAEANVDLRE